MSYFPNLDKEWNRYKQWLQLLKEWRGKTETFEGEAIRALKRWTESLRAQIERSKQLPNEPSTLQAIRDLRPKGPQRLVTQLNDIQLEDKLLGAWLGRAAGCILGIPSEGMTKNSIQVACKDLGLRYPLSDFWEQDPQLKNPEELHYFTTPRKNFLKANLKYIGADDDLTYTLLGLLILEEYGPDFRGEDVGEAWLKYLPMACTAEEVALANLKKGISASQSGAVDNPFGDWIGADIRSDSWGYAAPGWPEKAAEFAHRDAWISHRTTGIHGAMFFSATISAAFVVEDPIEALEIGLTEIPKDCRLAKTVKQTLRWCRKDQNWDRTTDRILKNYEGMSMAHTLNNAALTVAGLFYGQKNFEKTITLTVMGGLDTDCTGATAGSIIGTILGAKRLPQKWTVPLGNKVETYLKGKRFFKSERIARRFAHIARRVLDETERE